MLYINETILFSLKLFTTSILSISTYLTNIIHTHHLSITSITSSSLELDEPTIEDERHNQIMQTECRVSQLQNELKLSIKRMHADQSNVCTPILMLIFTIITSKNN